MKHPKHYDTDEATSRRMANVKLKHSSEEIAVAKRLWREGFRYWLNYRKLPGSPDIAIKKHRIAVFIDGEFWHVYNWSERKKKLKRNREYWVAKIEENIKRDQRVDKTLISLGWKPIHIWSIDVKKNLYGCIDLIKEKLNEVKL